MLPRTTVDALAKDSLPQGLKVERALVDLLQRATGDFLATVASEAQRGVEREGRKIMNPAHVTRALAAVGHGVFAAAVEARVAVAGGVATQRKESKRNAKRKIEALDPEEARAAQHAQLSAARAEVQAKNMSAGAQPAGGAWVRVETAADVDQTQWD